jgi:hypothetical protein
VLWGLGSMGIAVILIAALFIVAFAAAGANYGQV